MQVLLTIIALAPVSSGLRMRKVVDASSICRPLTVLCIILLSLTLTLMHCCALCGVEAASELCGDSKFCSNSVSGHSRGVSG